MQNYSLFQFGRMIGPDSNVRVHAYAAALRQAITPESVVLDIGTGPGFFALLAAKFGARHVYAVDPSGTVRLGRQLAEANGVADRITFLQDASRAVELPGGADVCVSDIRGALPWRTHHIASIVDARERLLKPDAVLIPRCDTVWAAIVDAPNLYAPHVAPWDDNSFDLDLGLARARTTNHVRKVRVEPAQLLVEPQLIATLDYPNISEPNAWADLSWETSRAGSACGMAAWFDAELAPGIEYSNRPGEPSIPIYGQTFFPWTDPVDVTPGDSMRVRFSAQLAKERYVFSWRTHVADGSTGQLKASFAQASFAGGAVGLGPDGDEDR